MRWHVVKAVARTAFFEFWRAPEAVFWTYGFPLLMTIVLGFAFQPRELEPVPVAVTEGAGAAILVERLQQNPRLRVTLLAAPDADAALARGRIAALLRPDEQTPSVRARPSDPEAELARLHIDRALGRGDAMANASFEPEDRPGARYIDFLIPGLVGLNLLGAGMWGIGFNLVQYRTQSLLRRLFVTPMRRSEFLFGFLLSRLLLAILIAMFGIVLWDVPFRGSWLAAAVIIILGSLAFSGLGVLVASRARTIEGVAGLMNLFMMPMWLLGGSFFSNDRMEGWLGFCADALPLSWCNDAMRALMLEPGGFVEVAGPLALLAAFAAACFALALRLFRWS